MNLEQKFKAVYESDFSFLKNKKLLIACSGGLDSVVLTKLISRIHNEYALAHCNFSLRGKESDTDEMFVIGLAKQLEVPVFAETFDTAKYAKQNGLSIQLAARELRYSWFYKIATDFKYDFILTAHQLDDDLETFLINLTRGTGLKGLNGIPAINQKVIRPLLNFSREELHQWAIAENISWREDSTNKNTDYLRNKIRLEVLPGLKNSNPQLLENFKITRRNLKSAERLIEDYMSLLFRLVVIEDKNGYRFNIEKLLDLPNTDAILYELLNGFGFTEWNDVVSLLSAQTGKQLYSKTHRLIRNRDELLLTPIPDNFEDIKILVPEEGIRQPIHLQIEEVQHITGSGRDYIYVDADKIDFPLILRKWKEGDIFYPFGMEGKKKLSKYFKDEKLSIPEKEAAWLLCSENEIIWVINYRADDRFKVDKTTKKIFKISVNADETAIM